jgi:hypothetical protein
LLIYQPVKSAEKVQEHEVLMSIMIGKMIDFIEWPDHKNNNEINILVFNNRDMYEALTAISRERRFDNKALVVQYVNSLHQIEYSEIDLLFIGSIDENKFSQLFKTLNDKPIFTISNSEGYAQKGIMVNFLIDQQNIVFNINETRARKAGFYINFKLLTIARKIY